MTLTQVLDRLDFCTNMLYSYCLPVSQSRNCFLLWGHVSFNFGFNLDWCRLDLYRFLLYVQVAFQNIANVNSAFLFNLNWFSGYTDSRIKRSETGEKLQEWFAFESAVKVVKRVFQFLEGSTEFNHVAKRSS